MPEGLRLSEILTTSAAVANYRGVPDVRALDVLDAIRILREEITIDDLGRPLSPLVSRVSGAARGATPGVRALAQQWNAQLGGDPVAELSSEALAKFEEQVRGLAEAEEAGGHGARGMQP